MPEAEDVIVGAARHATDYISGVWRRHRPRATDSGIELIDVRARLELLVQAVSGQAHPVRTAAQPPPARLLARLWGRVPRVRDALPCTDGRSVYLPAAYADAAFGLDLYRICALQQALRIERGSVAHYPWSAPPNVNAAYLLSEMLATDRLLLERAPGYGGMLSRVRAWALARRPAAHGVLEHLYRKTLAEALDAGDSSIPQAVTPAQSLRWAAAVAATSRDDFVSDWLVGGVLPADAMQVAHVDTQNEIAGSRPQVTRLARRPRVRSASPDEDDGSPGPAMVQTTEPSEHAEDPAGLQRPADREEAADTNGLAESVSSLDEARLVSTPGSPREVLAGDDPLPVRGRAHVPATRGDSAVVRYPEWDYREGVYRIDAVAVHVAGPAEGDGQWVAQVLRRHEAALRSIRRRFEALRARRSTLYGQAEGDDIDLEACVRRLADRRAGAAPDDRLYVVHRPARLDLALLILIDVSASTDAWIAGGGRVIDVEKEALILVATALEALRLDYALHAFSGQGPEQVAVAPLKDFDEAFTAAHARRVAGLEPEAYTRAGAAVRHATAGLMARRAPRRFLLILSDGRPNDCDQYEGRYGVEDLRQALAEARLQGITPYCVTVDRDAGAHLPGMFGAGHYTVVHEPRRLTRALVDWLRHVAVALK